MVTTSIVGLLNKSDLVDLVSFSLVMKSVIYIKSSYHMRHETGGVCLHLSIKAKTSPPVLF